MSKPSYIITTHSIVVHLNGETFTLQKGTAKGDQITALIKKQDWKALQDILSPAKTLPIRTGGLFTVGSDGQLYAIGDEKPIHNAIGKKLLSFLQEGLPCEPLINFWNNLKQNPSDRSIQQLYNFLEKNHHPLTDDGCFLAYKKVTKMPDGSLKDSHSRTFSNNIGEVVKMSRDKVNPDPNQTCSAGLHVASFEYAKGFSGDVLVVVKVNPRDVVAVPTDYNSQKMRTCQYEVLEHYGNETEMKTNLVVTKAPFKAAPVAPKQVEKMKTQKKEVTLTGLTAKEIISTVAKQLRNKSLNNMSLKNKQSIYKKALELFQKAGWKIN